MSPELLKDRAQILEKARAFFKERGLLEVDCCALVPRAPIDSNIDVIRASVTETESGFLHTSPEYAMKRLLATGSSDIYYLGHVFRKGEIGRLHSPEFTMAEWYRLLLSFEELIQETCEFLALFLGSFPIRLISYRKAFATYAGIDYQRDPLPPETAAWPREVGLQYLLTHQIEPKLGIGELTVLTDYPPSEAALARVVEKNGERVALRFEIYHEGVELANGYSELGDTKEIRRRFNEENAIRQSQNRETYLLDEAFLSALEKGFPPCCGVSVGFDRALMLRHRSHTLREVLPFAWKGII